MVVLDTNIIIDHIRSYGQSHLQILNDRYGQKDLAISVLTIQELYRGESTLINKEEIKLTNIIAPLTILQYNYQTAKLAGEITRDSKRLIEFADAAIAATCILNKATLATLNIKDFNKIPGIKLEKLF